LLAAPPPELVLGAVTVPVRLLPEPTDPDRELGAGVLPPEESVPVTVDCANAAGAIARSPRIAEVMMIFFMVSVLADNHHYIAVDVAVEGNVCAVKFEL
jgi:hypothetical protein